jgi:hypothetical protein
MSCCGSGVESWWWWWWWGGGAHLRGFNYRPDVRCACGRPTCRILRQSTTYRQPKCRSGNEMREEGRHREREVGGLDQNSCPDTHQTPGGGDEIANITAACADRGPRAAYLLVERGQNRSWRAQKRTQTRRALTCTPVSLGENVPLQPGFEVVAVRPLNVMLRPPDVGKFSVNASQPTHVQPCMETDS